MSSVGDTYSPARSSPVRSDGSPDAGERLFRLAQFYQDQKEKDRLASQAAEIDELIRQSFQPIPKSKQLAANRFSSSDNYGEQLYEESTSRMKGTKASPANAQRDEEESFDFQPRISDFAKHHARKEPIEHRLETVQNERKKKLESLVKQINEKNTKDLTFQPKINRYSFREKRDDFITNMENHESRRQLKMTKLQQELEVHNEKPFTPQISEYSKSLTRPDTIFNRLFSVHKNLSQSEIEQMETEFDKETGQKLFQPMINPSHSMRDENVEESLYRDAENRRLRRRMLQERTAQEEELNRTSRKITERSLKLAKRKLEKDLRKIFDEIDVQRKGCLNYTELGEALRQLGLFRQVNQSQRENRIDVRNKEEALMHQKLWKVLDVRGENSVDFPTFFRFMSLVLDRNWFDDDDWEEDFDEEMDSPTLRLVRDFSKMCLNKLAYHKPQPRSDIQSSDQSNCTFAPSINPLSRQLEANQTANLIQNNLKLSADPTKRYQILYQKAKEADERKELERLHHIDEELKDCTFTPQINKAFHTEKSHGGSGRSPKDNNHFETLYRQNQVPNSAMGQRTTEEKEIEEFCTFKPNTSLTKKKVVKKAAHTPRGYDAVVNRMRAAQERKKKEEEEKEKAFQVKNAGKRDVKPFSFQLDKRQQRSAPLLYMDVNLGPGKTGRIGIYEGDDPRVLARNFAVTYQLDDVLRQRLEDLLRQHVKDVIPTLAMSGGSTGPSGSRRPKTAPQSRGTPTRVDRVVDQDTGEAWDMLGHDSSAEFYQG